MKIRCNTCMQIWDENEIPTVHLKNGVGKFKICPTCLTDNYLVEVKPKLNMKDIYNAQIPGFYRDLRGAYCVMIGKYLISCHINEITNEYDVCIDIPASDGYDNIDWVSFDDADKAIEQLMNFIDHVINNLMK